MVRKVVTTVRPLAPALKPALWAISLKVATLPARFNSHRTSATSWALDETINCSSATDFAAIFQKRRFSTRLETEPPGKEIPDVSKYPGVDPCWHPEPAVESERRA